MPKGEYLQYGGQAVVEGVMMRSPKYFAVACRAPNGEIVLKTEHLEKTWLGRQGWLKWPFLRGSLALVDSMALGAKALRFAANVQTDPAYQPAPDPTSVIASLETASDPEANPAPASGQIQDIVIWGTVIVSLVLGFLIFNALPNTIAQLIGGKSDAKGTFTNYISETVKAILFLGYIWGIGQFPDIAEVFKYHGAEHKAINTLENGRPLEIDECVLQTRLHPRCGTSFAFIVFFLGFLFLPLVPRYPLGHHSFTPIDVAIRILVEFCLLPLIAGTAYEIIRLAGKFRSQAFVNKLYQPGMWSQYLTTREPNQGQIEVALTALKACIDSENRDGAPEPEPNEIESAPPLPQVG